MMVGPSLALSDSLLDCSFLAWRVTLPRRRRPGSGTLCLELGFVLLYEGADVV